MPGRMRVDRPSRRCAKRGSTDDFAPFSCALRIRPTPSDGSATLFPQVVLQFCRRSSGSSSRRAGEAPDQGPSMSKSPGVTYAMPSSRAAFWKSSTPVFWAPPRTRSVRPVDGDVLVADLLGRDPRLARLLDLRDAVDGLFQESSSQWSLPGPGRGFSVPPRRHVRREHDALHAQEPRFTMWCSPFHRDELPVADGGDHSQPHRSARRRESCTFESFRFAAASRHGRRGARRAPARAAEQGQPQEVTAIHP